MKKLLRCTSILLILVSVGQFYVNGQQCLMVDYPPEPDNPAAGPYESKNGWNFPTSGVVRVLMIFCQINYTGTTQDPTPPGGYPLWPADDLPLWANDVFDPDPPSGLANGLITRYYQYASSGALTVIGDYLVEPINGVFTVNNATGAPDISQGISSVNTALGSTGIVTGNGFTSISDFDSWTLSTSTTGPGLEKLSVGDQKYDHIMFIWRNSTLGPGSGFAVPSSPGLVLGYQSNSYSGYGAYNEMPVNIIRHETGHLIYGHNNFHCGGGGSGFDALSLNNYWISDIVGGWSNMSAFNGSLNSWNAWDRQRIDWKLQGNSFNPSVRNANNTAEVNGDLDATNSSQAGIYTLRDFVLTGDAIRIKLPFIDPQTEFQQWLWVENHQGRNSNSVYFDKWQFEDEACVEDLEPGLYMYLQIDKDIRFDLNGSSGIYGGYRDYLRPITADGFYDRTYDSNQLIANCINWGNNYSFIQAMPNPLTGHSDQELYPTDKNNDNQLDHTDGLHNITENKNGNYYDNLFQLGHTRHGFTLTGNKKLGIGTNPPSSSMMNLVGYDAFNNPTAPNLKRIYLNGLSIEMLSMSGGNIQVEIKFDDVDIENNVRWCAKEIVLSPINTTTGYSLNLNSGCTVLLDQGKSATKRINPQTINGEKIFADPTLFRCIDDSYFHMEANSTVIVDNNSTLKLESGSKFEVEDGAIVYVRNGGTLLIEDGADLIVNGTGKVYIESTGTIIYDGGDIILTDDNSILEIHGDLEIGANAVFTFTGDGFIRFNLPQTWGFPNVLAAPTSSVVLEGSSKSDKIVEIIAGSWLSPTDNFADFTIKNGTVMMGVDAFINMGSRRVELNNIKVTKLNTLSEYAHMGIFVNGQQNHTIKNVEIEHGTVGLTARNFYSDGADVFIRDSYFHDNEVGLRTISKGANLKTVEMNDNLIGWEAVGMENPSNITYGYVHDNEAGIQYSCSGSGSLHLDRSAVDRNFTDGVFHSGPAMVSAKCGSVRGNWESGFKLGKESFLYLGNTGIPTLKAGSVDVSDNELYNLKFLPNSNQPFLELGNNNLSLNPSISGSLIAEGVILWPCFGNVPNIIYASNNQWYDANPSNPPSPSDYDLKTFNCIPNKKLYFDDPYPQQKINCPLIPISPDPEELRLYSPLVFCEYCPVIYDEVFEEPIDFREAVIRAMNLTTFADSSENDETLAMDMFNAIVRAAAEYYDDDRVQWLSTFSYYYLKQTLGSAVSMGTIEGSIDDPYFIKVNELQNLLIELAINYDEPLKQFFYRADQALLYNLANDRLTALALLEESAACIELDEELLEWVNHWRAHINAVEIINTGQAHVMEYDNLYREGYNSGLRLNAGLGVAKRDTVIQSSIAFSISGSQTANDNSGNSYTISSVVKDSLTDFLIVKYNSTSNILWSDTIGGWSRGADTARVVTVDDWDNVYISGQAWNGSNYDIMTVKYDSLGAKQWIAMYNSPDKWNDIPYGITVDTSEFVYVALHSTSDSGSYHSLITYSQCNCPTGQSLRNGGSIPEDNLQTNYLESNLEIYPNPANKLLTITFTDAENPISVKMVNALGQEIYKNIFNGSLNIDVSDYPKGVYLLHLEEKTGGMRTVKKVLLQ